METSRPVIQRMPVIGLILLAAVLLAAVATRTAGRAFQWRAELWLLLALVFILIGWSRTAWLRMRELSIRATRLEALYAFSNFVADVGSDALTAGIPARILDIMHADGIALRLCHQGQTAFEVLMGGAEHNDSTVTDGLADGAQAVVALVGGASVQRVLLDDSAPEALQTCRRAGMRSLVYVSVSAHQQRLADIVLYYRQEVILDAACEEVIAAIKRHLAAAVESQRARSLERESAITTERYFIARELHDSIAQSLGFLKIQIHLLRKAIDKNDQNMAAFVLAELDAGLANSIADVRELLVHFRTRTDSGKIETAIQETIQKFQNQSGLKVSFEPSGDSAELAPDVQIQVLNVLQESLSNIRKHAQASHVDIRLERGPVWRLAVRDDGKGFDTGKDRSMFNVGLTIMRERAEMIGATLVVDSAEGSGTTVSLMVPQASKARHAVPATVFPFAARDAAAPQPPAQAPAHAPPHAPTLATEKS